MVGITKWAVKDDKNRCSSCNVILEWKNTSPSSMSKELCHTCHNEMVNAGIIKP